jgi:hypothetical protein
VLVFEENTDMTKKSNDLFKKRLKILDRIKDPERMSVSRARKTVLSRFEFDPEMHLCFMQRPDLTKKEGLTFCKRTKWNPRNWFLLFENKNLNFSVPEMLFWSIVADNNYNQYAQIFRKHPNKERESKISDFSILTRVLVKKEFIDYAKNASSIDLLILKIKLNDEKVVNAIEKERKNFWDDTKNMLPIRFLSFLIVVITYIPLRILLSPKIDLYLQQYFNKKRH